MKARPRPSPAVARPTVSPLVTAWAVAAIATSHDVPRTHSIPGPIPIELQGAPWLAIHTEAHVIGPHPGGENKGPDRGVQRETECRGSEERPGSGGAHRRRKKSRA